MHSVNSNLWYASEKTSVLGYYRVFILAMPKSSSTWSQGFTVYHVNPDAKQDFSEQSGCSV